MLLHTEEYFDYLRDVKRSSDSTIQSYKRDINKFNEYIEKVQTNNRINYKTIVSYLAFMQKSGQATSSVLRTIASLRSYFGYIVSKGYIDEDPMEDIKAPKAKEREFEILTSHETELLLMQPECVNFKGYRDKAMLELLYATGIKVSELIELKFEDINIADAYLVCGGDAKARVVPIGKIAAKAVKEYIDWMENSNIAAIKHNDFLFVNINGGKLSRQGFWKIVKFYKEKAKIKKSITPNTLRHSFAVHLMENGADVEAVQEMLGHKAKLSTKVYSNIVNKRINEVYKKAHPRA